MKFQKKLNKREEGDGRDSQTHAMSQSYLHYMKSGLSQPRYPFAA
jgi:hypothetical protein